MYSLPSHGHDIVWDIKVLHEKWQSYVSEQLWLGILYQQMLARDGVNYTFYDIYVEFGFFKCIVNALQTCCVKTSAHLWALVHLILYSQQCNACMMPKFTVFLSWTQPREIHYMCWRINEYCDSSSLAYVVCRLRSFVVSSCNCQQRAISAEVFVQTIKLGEPSGKFWCLLSFIATDVVT